MQTIEARSLTQNGTTRWPDTSPVPMEHADAVSNGANASTHHETLKFEQVRDKVQADDKGKWDIVLPRSEVVMQDGRIIFPDCKAYECENGIIPSRWATGQICSRLNIPTSYFRRCPAHLQDTQFNHWNARGRSEKNPASEDTYASYNGSTGNGQHDDIWEDSEPREYHNGFSNASENGHRFKNGIYAGAEKSDYWLLRAKGETLRAVLTDRYTPLDNRMLLDTLQKAIPDRLEVQWLALDDDSFHLRLIDPTLSREVLDGDPVMAGIHIANSETGMRSISLDSLVYRQVCSNGLVKLVRGKSILSQRHVAVSPPHFTALLKQSLSIALSTASGFLEQMQWATKEPVRDIEAEMKSLMQHWHLSQDFTEQIKSSLQKERSDQQETVFGLVNAVTQAAQSLDAEARYNMEALAGKFLEQNSMRSHKSEASGRKVRVVEDMPSDTNVAEAIEAAEVLFEAEAVTTASNINGEAME